MNSRFLTVLITLAFLGFSVTAIAKGKPGGSDNTDEVPRYTAELTGDFEFLSAGLTTKRKGKSLSGNDTLEVLHNGNEAGGGGIFGKDCSALLTESGVNAFEVPDDWGISYTRSRGGLDQVHITMNDLIIVDPDPGTSGNYSQVDFDLHLHGEIAQGEDFLPEADSVVSHTLTRYMLWAGGLGEEGWFICNSTGGGMETWEVLLPGITLTITRE